MAGLPKKYAKMGFKKGWRAYKASKGKSRKSYSRTVRKTVAKRRSRTMAKRRTYRKKSAFGGVAGLVLGGAGYGVIREPLSQLSAKIPMVGGLGDEVALMGASYLMATKGSGIIRKIGRAGLVIEAHNLARNLAGGVIGAVTGGATTTVPQSGMSFK